MARSSRPRAAAPAAPLPLFDWLRTRGAGVLLHPTALPGDQGCGVLDAHAVAFLDFLREAGVRYWQICPLGPTGYGDSPYSAFSAFAGNPLLVDLDALVPAGLLAPADLAPLAALPRDRVDFAALAPLKHRLLDRAFAAFRARPAAAPYGDFAAFRRAQAAWLDDYALFAALK